MIPVEFSRKDFVALCKFLSDKMYEAADMAAYYEGKGDAMGAEEKSKEVRELKGWLHCMYETE